MARSWASAPAVALPMALAVACAQAPPIETCEDPLGGLWRSDADPARRYHVWELGPAGLEIVPLWDTSIPPGGVKVAAGDDTQLTRSPMRIRLARRSPAEIAGGASYRLAQSATRCEVHFPARVSGCRGRTLVLSSREPAGAFPAVCTAPPGPWLDEPLTRE